MRHPFYDFLYGIFPAFALLSFLHRYPGSPFIGDITWAWVYGVSITVMSVWVCSIYVRKSERIDEQIKEIIEKEGL
ncbi:DUF485 domain-containing protein [Bacillus sp. ISL-4]|uniref:DUF485 domain-containing protein n=1 Tax=Bacillus sp. ISL-4 TaxID=2819125 RepID=UPI001BECBAFE|nr:DUF485 domain-containing protein [Bacillus sp. ISL-4]